MHTPHGYTILDLIAAASIIAIVSGAIVLLLGPTQEVKRAYDVVRERDVRNIAEAFFEFSYREPETRDALLADYGTGRFLIGTGYSCEGTFGIQCTDATVEDRCLNLEGVLSPVYLSSLPVDPRMAGAGEHQTGYYFSWDGDQFTIGACDPEARSNIEIRSRF